MESNTMEYRWWIGGDRAVPSFARAEVSAAFRLRPTTPRCRGRSAYLLLRIDERAGLRPLDYRKILIVDLRKMMRELTLPTPVSSLTPILRRRAGGAGGGDLRRRAAYPLGKIGCSSEPMFSSPERRRRCGLDERFNFWAALKCTNTNTNVTYIANRYRLATHKFHKLRCIPGEGRECTATLCAVPEVLACLINSSTAWNSQVTDARGTRCEIEQRLKSQKGGGTRSFLRSFVRLELVFRRYELERERERGKGRWIAEGMCLEGDWVTYSARQAGNQRR